MDMKRIMMLGSINTSPDKTEVKTTSNSISVKTKGCKGRVKRREQCKTCDNRGIYQAGILAWMPCCSREPGWRRIEGTTERKCKDYIMKGDNKDA